MTRSTGDVCYPVAGVTNADDAAYNTAAISTAAATANNFGNVRTRLATVKKRPLVDVGTRLSTIRLIVVPVAPSRRAVAPYDGCSDSPVRADALARTSSRDDGGPNPDGESGSSAGGGPRVHRLGPDPADIGLVDVVYQSEDPNRVAARLNTAEVDRVHRGRQQAPVVGWPRTDFFPTESHGGRVTYGCA